ncbi:adenylate/guanylate cyclase domain-containing protein [Radicibacter daui]|uniref:adenylate/guanylate cyclase domain-containing protein n=1 Tax=Radicibacter daui TaxID=3064829 RepID=UPI004046E5F4
MPEAPLRRLSRLRRFFPRRRRGSVSLRYTLITRIAGLMITALGLVLGLGLVSGLSNTDSLLRQQAQLILDKQAAAVNAVMTPIEAEAQWLARQVAEGTLDVNDRDEMVAALRAATAGTPQALGVGVIFENRHLIKVEREGAEVQEEDLSRETKVTRMLEEERAGKGGHWAEPVVVASEGQTLLNYRIPLLKDDRFLGVLMIGLSVADISRQLTFENDVQGITSFVLYGRDRVVIHPALSDWRPVDKHTPALPRARDIGDPVLAQWAEHPDKVHDEGMVAGGNTHLYSLRVPGEGSYVMLTRSETRFGVVPWTIGAHMSIDLVAREMQRLRWAAMTGLVVVVIAILVALAFGRKLALPTLRLARAARQVQEGEFATIAPLPGDTVREFDDAARAFNLMVRGLREREQIRDLFGKYLPEAVATALLKDGGEMTPISTEATVLFCDLEGFTTLSEQLAPPEIVTMLNEYFSTLVEVLEQHGGVVTQFQGDAILATFNVPLPSEKHAECAISAARDILEEVKRRRFAGHRLGCRIGICTGQLMAGAVGASGRLSYTVHGDAVNVAARLEQMNKECGTSLLVSARTAELVGYEGLVGLPERSIRGRQESMRLYTVAPAIKVVAANG